MKLNLGDNRPEWKDQKKLGWTCVDLGPRPEDGWIPDVVADLRKAPLPWPDDSADYIYSSHFIEHITHAEARVFLRECHRILKPGGVLRIIWPEFSYTEVPQMSIVEYLSGARPWSDPELQGRERYTVEFLAGMHKYAYDLTTMRYELGLAGFKCIAEAKAHKGSIVGDEVLAFLDSEGIACEARK